MDQNRQDGNGPTLPTGADFVAAALAAARAAGGGAGAGGPGAAGGGQNQGQQQPLAPGVPNQAQNQAQNQVQNGGLAPGGLNAVNGALNDIQLQINLAQYDFEITGSDAIILQQGEIVKDAQRRIAAAIQCIKAACAKKGAELNSDEPMQVSAISVILKLTIKIYIQVQIVAKGCTKSFFMYKSIKKYLFIDL